MVGYRRYEGIAAAKQLARLYAPVRLFVNTFQPSFKLAKNMRDGARVTKRYHKPMAPCDRLLSDARVTETTRERILALRADRRGNARLVLRVGERYQCLLCTADLGQQSNRIQNHFRLAFSGFEHARVVQRRSVI